MHKGKICRHERSQGPTVPFTNGSSTSRSPKDTRQRRSRKVLFDAAPVTKRPDDATRSFSPLTAVPLFLNPVHDPDDAAQQEPSEPAGAQDREVQRQPTGRGGRDHAQGATSGASARWSGLGVPSTTRWCSRHETRNPLAAATSAASTATWIARL